MVVRAGSDGLVSPSQVPGEEEASTECGCAATFPPLAAD